MGASGPKASSYDLRIASERGGAVPTSSGLAILTDPLSAFDDVEIDTLVVAGGASALRLGSTHAAVEDWIDSQKRLVAWIAGRAPHVRRVCSVCTGTFLLAAAGQLDGRTVTTHWSSASLLAECFPGLRAAPDHIFIHDGPVWTSGGVTSGIDLALALVEDDFGAELAMKTARIMVVFVKRPGGQSQFSVPLAAQVTDRGNFAALHAWMAGHLTEDLSIQCMTFAGVFAAWSETEIADYLGTGRNAHAAVGGEMKSAVEHSLCYLTGPDLQAIAIYLKGVAIKEDPATTPAGKAMTTTAKLTAPRDLTPGERLYLDNCGACHFVGGQGAARVFPSLDGASIVNAENPTGLIDTILAGAAISSTARSPSVLPMPGFAYRLSDQEAANLASFVRSGWAIHASAVTADQVATVRAKLGQH